MALPQDLDAISLHVPQLRHMPPPRERFQNGRAQLATRCVQHASSGRIERHSYSQRNLTSDVLPDFRGKTSVGAVSFRHSSRTLQVQTVPQTVARLSVS